MNDERNLGEKTDDSGQQPRYEHYQFHEEQGTVLKLSLIHISWYRAYIPTEETLETQRKQKFDYSPLISIAVPAYQTPVEFLRQMIESVSYTHLDVYKRQELEKQKKTSFGYRPKISFVVPLYKTPEKYLRRLTESFQEPVSYTHLDVYKRQAMIFTRSLPIPFFL